MTSIPGTSKVEALVVGHAAYDLSIFVDGFPHENSKRETHVMIEGGGGPAANAAYLLSRWEVGCSFAGLMGDDYYGQRIAAEFRSVGTDLALTEVRHGHPTPLSFIMVNTRNGTRTIVNRKAKQGALCLSSSQLDKMSPQVLLFDGHELEATRVALGHFPEVASILDAGSLRPSTEELAGEVDYLVASERFALQASALSDLATQESLQECLRRLRAIARPDATIVVTLGERGLIYDMKGDCSYIPAYPARAVDTTGAGDIFHGAFAYGVLRKLSLEETLKLASMTAALSVQQRGGRQSIPPLETVRQALGDAEGKHAPSG